MYLSLAQNKDWKRGGGAVSLALHLNATAMEVLLIYRARLIVSACFQSLRMGS